MPVITVSSKKLGAVSDDVLLLPVLRAAKDDGDPTVLGSTDLSKAAGAAGVSGSAGETTRVPSFGLVGSDSVVLVGLGATSLDEVDAETVRRAFGAATRSLSGVGSAALAFPTAPSELLAAAVEGAALGAYSFVAHKTADATSAALGKLTVVLSKGQERKALQAAITRAESLAASVNVTRDLVNTPPNLLYPEEFARRARKAVADLPITVTVLDEKQLAAGGYGGIVGVGQGSSRPPRLVKLEYAPRRAKQHVALVGKGITFDTGGISLKPAPGMDEMTSDMGGAATVLGAVVGTAKLGLGVKVTVFLAIAENMPGGNAQRPGDVVTMRNGTTVEVLNTDAEGRMVMADALVDAAATGADLVMDVATLTGAAVVALGKRTAAVMGSDSARDEVMAASTASGEPFWPMPFPEEIQEDLKGRVADLKNVGERPGGMLWAGMFLREFVGEKTWAHLDIAGPAFTTKPYGYANVGATGMSVRTLIEVLEARSR